MSKYGEAAEIAARRLISRQEIDPGCAWTFAVETVFPESASARAKSCPRVSFLSLCEFGAIEHVKPGTYTRSVKNKGYVQRALEALREEPLLILDERQLWQKATGGSGTTDNSQMDVLACLWRAGLVREVF